MDLHAMDLIESLRRLDRPGAGKINIHPAKVSEFIAPTINNVRAKENRRYLGRHWPTGNVLNRSS